MISKHCTERARTAELMDDPAVDLATMRDALDEVDLVNRHLGGWSASLWLLRRRLLSRTGDRPVHILDLGAGSGGTARVLSRWATSHGVSLRWTLVDLHSAVCAVAGSSGAAASSVIRADIRALPFRDQAFDFAHASLLFHHLSERDIETSLLEMNRVAHAGIVVNDLERHPLALHAIEALTRLFSRSSLVLHDAPASVRRGFRLEEMRAWQRVVGYETLGVRRRFPFRLLAWKFADGGEP